MLYFVGGASRSGKTTIARKISRQYQVPYVSIDWLMMGFTNGIPEYGIHDLLFPDEIAERIWSFLKAMCESMIWVEVDVVIEGEAILPELLKDLVEAYPAHIRACFIGYADVDVDQKSSEVRMHSEAEDDWLAKKSDEYVRDHTVNMIEFSQRIKADCDRHNMPYFETSKDLSATMEAVGRALGLASPII